MQKLKREVQFKNIIGVIYYYAGTLGMTKDEVFREALISKGTMYNRIKAPQQFTLSELLRLAKVLNIPFLKLLTGEVVEQEQLQTERTILK